MTAEAMLGLLGTFHQNKKCRAPNPSGSAAALRHVYEIFRIMTTDSLSPTSRSYIVQPFFSYTEAVVARQSMKSVWIRARAAIEAASWRIIEAIPRRRKSGLT